MAASVCKECIYSLLVESPSNSLHHKYMMYCIHLRAVQEEALCALRGVKGIVELVGVGCGPSDTRQWLVMQPAGVHIELDAPAAVKIEALKELATVIGSLASRNFIHGDISHSNVLRKDCALSDIATGAAELDVFLIDFGMARRDAASS